jgi:hypothetical protein
MSLRSTKTLGIAAFAMSAILLLKHLLLPLNPDNDTYHAMAWQLYKYGELPYLGSWDQNFPGVVYIHWLAITLFGNTALGFRALDALFHLANAMLLFSLVRRFLSARAAALSAVLYILYYTHDSYWLAGQRDGFAMTFVLLALWCNYRSFKYRYLAIGLFLGCATVIRPTFAIFALAILLLERSDLITKLRDAAPLAFGALLIWIIQFIPYALTANGPHEYYLATIRFTADLYGGHALPWSNLLLWNRAQKIYFTILFIGAVVLLIRRRSLMPEDARLRRFVSLMFVASALPVLVMRKFSIYHFDPLFTLLTPICAYLLLETARAFKRYRHVAFLFFMALIAFRMFPRHVVKDFVKAPESAGSRLDYVYDRIDHDSLYGERAERELAQYLRRHTREDERIELASIWPGAQWMAERQKASRFTTWYALAMTQDGKQTQYQREWQTEYVSDIRRQIPKYVVIARGPKSFLIEPKNEPWEMFFRLEGMQQLMQERYVPDTTIKGFDLYRLRE